MTTPRPPMPLPAGAFLRTRRRLNVSRHGSAPDVGVGTYARRSTRQTTAAQGPGYTPRCVLAAFPHHTLPEEPRCPDPGKQSVLLGVGSAAAAPLTARERLGRRSEERRVGKEGRSRW